MANKENVQKLIDQISYSEKYKGPRFGAGPTGFAMESWFDDRGFPSTANLCRTTACLAGHISLIQNGLKKTRELEVEAQNELGRNCQIFKEGCEFLGISDYQGQKLFLLDHTPFSLWEPTADDAIKTLEGLRDTGKISWDHIDT